MDDKIPVFEIEAKSARGMGWDLWVCRSDKEASERLLSDLDEMEEGETIKVRYKMYTPAQLEEVVFE